MILSFVPTSRSERSCDCSSRACGVRKPDPRGSGNCESWDLQAKPNLRTPHGRTALKAGRLTGEVKSSGFEALAGFEIPDQPEPRAVRARDELAERRRQRDELQRKRRDLKERVRKLSARARGEERDAERAEEAATDARNVAEKSRREAEEAAAELEKLDQ
jgi:chromosome segregation ATPase